MENEQPTPKMPCFATTGQIGRTDPTVLAQNEAPLTTCPTSSAQNEAPLTTGPTSSAQNEAPLTTGPTSSAQNEAPLTTGPTSSAQNEDPLTTCPTSSAQNEANLTTGPTSSAQNEASPTTLNTNKLADIGTFYDRTHSLSDAERFDCMVNIFNPDRGFVFPKREIYGWQRAFNIEWLSLYPWLAYSACLDGAFCKYCVYFGHAIGKNASKLDKLYHSPLTNWQKATTKFKQHQDSSEFHKTAIIMGEEFMKRMKQQSKPVIDQLLTVNQERIERNRQVVKSICKCVILCGKQAFPLRGNRDDSTAQTGNRGNFQALLDFRVESGDKVLGDYFNKCPSNARYRSKTIQNEIIDICGKYIQKNLTDEIRQTGGIFAVLADEATDISNQEQLPLVLRYVDASNHIREDFVGFFHCPSVTGECISGIIQTAVADLGLDLQKCVGQGYDGAGNMSGEVKGAAARIRKEYPMASYFHCAAHKLNLCVVKTCSNTIIRNTMDTIGELSRFFSFSPKRQQLLKTKINELNPNSNKQKLQDICVTRWLGRIDAIESFLELMEPVLETLDTIRQNNKDWNRETVTKASGFLTAIEDFQFLFAASLLGETLGLLRGLTAKLQTKELDLRGAYKDVTVVRDAVVAMRENVNETHKQVMRKAKALAEPLHVPVELEAPRVCGRQKHRANAPSRSAEDHFRMNMTIPFLDHFSQELQSRFYDGQQEVIQGWSVIPQVAVTLANWREPFKEFCERYEVLFPNVAAMDAELCLWGQFCRHLAEGDEPLPTTAKETLQVCDSIMYPNIAKALQIMCTLPVSTSECERSVSALRRLKTYTRSTMGEERLTGLALLHVHHDMPINVEQIVTRFAQFHPRRLSLENIFS